jgi:hypothetical protein
MEKKLIIVPCSASKIWSTGRPSWDEMPACGAYRGQVWGVQRRFAEIYGSTWIILSAKYGFITPETMIRDYDESFIKGTTSVTEETLRFQARSIADSYPKILSLGSRPYNDAIRKAFDGLDAEIEYPLEGLAQLLARQWVIHRLPEPEGGRDNETYQESSARKRRKKNEPAQQIEVEF